MSNKIATAAIKRRTLLQGGLALGALQIASPFVGSANAAGQVTLRMHTHVPPVSGSFKNLLWWTKKVEKESGGKLKIDLYGSMQLGGKAADVYDQVKNGVVDLGWTLPGYKAGLFPATEVFELPFIGAPAHIVSPAIDTYVRKYAQKEWSHVHPIVVHSAGLSEIHMKTRKIEKLEDFKGMKIRTPSRISSDALSALGATPVPIPSLKMTEAMMHGVVDGVVAPWSIALAIRAIDIAKYHTVTTLHEPILALLMNKESYAGLSPDLKKAMDANSGEWLAKEFGRRWEHDDKLGIARAKKLGHPIIDLSKAEQMRWRKVTEPVYQKWIKTMDAKGMDGKKLVEAAEALVAKYKAEA
ncbi:MAG TPA: TRAP transporter substrate-binding protein [Pseudolabrys sp.]|nr:TRAP transporter substrate-binding protein [Pseudolabrys sp.]